MRKIKFRAWDEGRREFLSGGQILLSIEKGRNPQNSFYLDVFDKRYKDKYKDRFVLQQYTGLKDKNDKEIYEGDIVKQFADCNELGNSLYFFYEIGWNNEYCAFEGVEIYSKETFLFPDLEDIEVIGNIFDNPELLEESE